MSFKVNTNTPALWSAWEDFIRANWPCTRAYLRQELKIDTNASKSLFDYAAKMIDGTKRTSNPKRKSTEVDETTTDNEKTITVKGSRIKTLEQLLEISETDLDTWEVKTHKVNSWEMGAKGPDGEICVETLFQVTANLERRFNPRNMQTVIYDDMHSRDPATAPKNRRRAVVIPDLQLGFRWKKNYSYLEPMHDRLAMDLVWQYIIETQPDEIIFIGDDLDLAAWSKFDPTPDLKQTTQPALNELYWWLARLRRECPNAKIKKLEGNHDARLGKAATRAVEELFYIKRAGSELGVLSHTELLGLDNLQIKMIEPYNSEYWLWSTVRCHHGREVTTSKIINSMQYHSEVQGHTHRLALNYRTVHGPAGARHIFSMQPGSLCKIDGPPSYGERNDWQQGFGVLNLIDNQVMPQVYSIQQGHAYVDGKMYVGQDPSEQIARDIGWKQIGGI